jgi:hypothetical protein
VTNIPHFDFPFRFSPNAHAAVVEQDSVAEIESCLMTILLTEEGQRIELPEFGIESPLFRLQPLPLDGILNAILDQEPRATVTFSQQPDPIDYLTALVTLQTQIDDSISEADETLEGFGSGYFGLGPFGP